MSEKDISFFEKDIQPVTQLKYALGTTLTIQFLYYMFNRGATDLSTLSDYYTIPMAFTLVFGIFNAILSLSSKDQNKYYGVSIINYVIYCGVTITVGRLLSGISIDEAGSYRWIYFVFSFGYVFFLALVRTMRWIVNIAQKNDKRMRGG
jgi:hypothetical protein